MAKKRTTTEEVTAKPITAERAARLYRMLMLLGRSAQTRDALTKKLKLDVRGFYRDVEVLRQCGISLALEKGRYHLGEELAQTLIRLPFPDPHLNLGEARQLAKGRSSANKKLRILVEGIER